jgi:hypothetical protein
MERSTLRSPTQDEGALCDLGGAPFTLTPAEFGKLITNETEIWGKVVRAANIKPG